MMKPGSCATAFAAGFVTAIGAAAQAVVGQPAPAFSAVDATGKTVSLADYKGKHVVLEWVNPGCPYVQKHYNSGNMPATQKAAIAKGVTWLTVSSTAKDAGDYRPPSRPGRVDPRQGRRADRHLDGRRRQDRPRLRRPHHAAHVHRSIRRASCSTPARSTASRPSNPADIATATNYVSQAIGEVARRQAGEPADDARLRLLDQVRERGLIA